MSKLIDTYSKNMESLFGTPLKHMLLK